VIERDPDQLRELAIFGWISLAAVFAAGIGVGLVLARFAS
jgi:hypothetical protein